MGKFSNALQGNLNDDKGPGKGRGERQLDLFLSLSDRPDAKPRLASSHLPAEEESAGNTARPEPEMVLPPPREPPDVSAEVRAVLSESGPPRPVENTDPGGTARPPLRTGIYRRPPRRVSPPPAAAAPRPSGGPPLRRAWGRLRDWLGEVEMDRRMVSLVVLLVVLVAIAAFWSACPRSPEPGTTVDLRELQAESDAPPAGAAVAAAPAAPAAPKAPSGPPLAPPPAAAAADWKIAGAETTVADGIYHVKFADPVFVSANYLSPEGVRALKSLAAKLVTLKAGARVTVTGHTDDIPLSRPTPQFRSNADLAEARARAAMEHLAHYARANKALTFDMRAGTLADAPYPNDSDRNRRLNRTATIQVVPVQP
ncbi:MAG: hypothetical protein PHU50_03885 [Kiritimatiellae bacterium]|nr:hypothetical protein [Kiritimatiellia bacterium]